MQSHRDDVFPNFRFSKLSIIESKERSVSLGPRLKTITWGKI